MAFADVRQFSNYPVSEIYQGTNHPAIDEGRFSNLFPERQKILEKQKVNFAGHYIVYTQQCGENYISPVITDARTGKYITYLGKYYLQDKSKNLFSVEYKSNSNLLIVSETTEYIWKYPTRTYRLMNQGNTSKLGYYDFHKKEHCETNLKKLSKFKYR